MVQLAIACCEKKEKASKKVAEINAIRSIAFSIDGFEDMEIRVHIKFTFDTL